jgi:hypothetical protein
VSSVVTKQQSITLNSRAENFTLIPSLLLNPDFSVSFSVLPRYGVLSSATVSSITRDKTVRDAIVQYYNTNNAPTDSFSYLVSDGTLNFMRVDVTVTVAGSTTGAPSSTTGEVQYYPMLEVRMPGSISSFDQAAFVRTVASSLGM